MTIARAGVTRNRSAVAFSGVTGLARPRTSSPTRLPARACQCQRRCPREVAKQPFPQLSAEAQTPVRRQRR
jgi:hypothetical protein